MVALLRDRGADAGAVTAADRALGAFVSGADAAPPRADVVALDAMLVMAVQGGHTRTVERLLDAGARVDGDPGTDEVPLGQAAWRRRQLIVRLLLARGARLVFPGGGSAIGAALHGSRHCQHPEGGERRLEKAVHDVQPDVAVRRMREGLGHGADHREAQRAP